MNILIYALLTFNFIFPKAGLKIAEFPLYIGVILSLFLSLLMYYEVIKRIKKNKKEGLYIALTVIIFLFNLVLPMIFSISEVSLSRIIISVYAIIVYPIFYFLPIYYEKINYLKFFKIALIILIIYGYLQKIFGDYTVVIPGLTANYSDAIIPNFLSQKNNMLHSIGVLKLTSTYQNGNLFGLNLTLLFWTLIRFFKNKKIVMLLYFPVILFTGSASSYLANLGIIIIISLYSIFVKKEIKYLKILTIVVVILFFLSFLIDLNSFEILKVLKVRLLERDLSKGGGRIANLSVQIKYLQNIKDYLLGVSLKTLDTNEMIVVNIFFRYGLVGIFLFTMRLILFLNLKIPLSFYFGIIAYLLNSFFDSAINYPPVYFNYFLIMGFVEVEYRKRLKYEKNRNNT